MTKFLTKIFLGVLVLLSIGTTANAALPPAQVFIVAGSNINMVSRESKVPVSVQNNYDRAVRIRVHARATNAQVNVQDYVSLTVPANSRKDALIPISVISNGEFQVKVWVTTFTDIRIGATTDLKLTANPDIELYILFGFGSLIVVLVGLGASRMIRRNKSEVNV
jgi:hypothetical protein